MDNSNNNHTYDNVYFDTALASEVYNELRADKLIFGSDMKHELEKVLRAIPKEDVNKDIY